MASIAHYASLLAATGLGATAATASAATISTLNVTANSAMTDIAIGGNVAQFSYGLPSNTTKSQISAYGNARVGGWANTDKIGTAESFGTLEFVAENCPASCTLINASNPYLHLKFQIGSADYYGVAGFSPTGTLESVSYQAAVSAVPEPAEWALLTIGFGLAGAALRRERRETALGLAA
jgi:hypothetical protein